MDFHIPLTQNLLRLMHIGSICMAGKCKLFSKWLFFLVKKLGAITPMREKGAQPLGDEQYLLPITLRSHL